MEDSKTNFQPEPLTEITTDTDDCRNVLDFFQHFKIEIPAYLSKAIDNYEAVLGSSEPELAKLDAQNHFRIALCKAMIESDHPLFKDELFDTVIKNSTETVFLANFDEQVQTALKKD